MKNETVTIPAEQLEDLLTQNEEYKKEVDNLLIVAYGICGVLGLVDESGKIKPSYLNNEESPMPAVLKAVVNTATLMAQAGVPVLGKKAEAQIAKKFEFIKHLVPIINKYQK